MKLLYPDTSVIRSFSDQPEKCNDLYDQLIAFDSQFKMIPSYYLFFEYLGFTKKWLELPTIIMQPSFDSKLTTTDLTSRDLTEEEISILDSTFSKCLREIIFHISNKLYSLKSHLYDLKTQREKRTSRIERSQKLINVLFGDKLLLMENDFNTLVECATPYLAWDVFCGIRPANIPLSIARERQLALWLAFRDCGIHLPFGKIIDDQSSYYKMNFSSQFKEFEDMVDSEMHTFVVLGYEVDKQVYPVHCFTYTPKDLNALSKRTELALGTIINIEKTQQR